ncbi:MAG: hypothetical protein ACK46X_04715 [Candidatus Sericytochromatia bacterium]
MRISPVATPLPRYRAIAQVQPAAEPARIVRTADGPPPEYSLWSMLKDVGSRIVSGIKRLFGAD